MLGCVVSVALCVLREVVLYSISGVCCIVMRCLRCVLCVVCVAV